MGDGWNIVKADFHIDRAALERAVPELGFESVEHLLEYMEEDIGMDFQLDERGNVVGVTLAEDVEMPSEFEQSCAKLAPYIRRGSFLVLEIEDIAEFVVYRIEFDGEEDDWIEEKVVEKVEEKPKQSWFRRLLDRI
jgi:hypothetical protein